MRAVWLALALSACGDNTHAPGLDIVAQLPAATALDLAFDRDNTAVVRLAGGSVRRRAGDTWRTVALPATTSQFGSDTDGAPLVTAGAAVLRIDGGTAAVLGGAVPSADLELAMAAPSQNRYASERGGARRTFVLVRGAAAWVESPPMFAGHPVRTSRGAVYEAVASGVQRFGADGTRTLAIPCAQLERASCADVIVAGESSDGRLVVADDRGLATVAGELGDHVERTPIPGEPVRAVVGRAGVVVLARRSGAHALVVVRAGEAVVIDTSADEPSADTRLAVDRDGEVVVATAALSRIDLP